MTHRNEAVTPADLQAYVDGQLSAERHIAVEAYLAASPAEAALVMADLRTRDELRLAFALAPPLGRAATVQAARRLSRSLAGRRLMMRVRRVAVLALFVAAGWTAHAEYGAFTIGHVVASTPPPAYVEDAIIAHRTAVLRAQMLSQPVLPSYDPEEIRTRTAIALPRLPEGWQVTDVQVFPSRLGPSIEVAVSAPGLGRLSLFAVRPGRFAVAPVGTTAQDGVSAAFWQLGEVGYALVGALAEKDLGPAARDLSQQSDPFQRRLP
jgi:anti-sigma factor RsiW